jgi:predicted hydrolase (HD superfamily)
VEHAGALAESAWALVCQYTQSASLRRHMRATGVAMRAYAERLGEDPDRWQAVGYLHDFDYERHPEAPDHPVKGERILAELGWDDDIRRAILSHADYTGVERKTPMEKALHACDDVTGFVVAATLVRPDRDIRAMKLSSLRKKWKDRRFAGGVDRDEVEAAAAAIGSTLDDHLAHVLAAMQAAAPELGLDGAD